MLTPEQIESIAALAHEANRAYCAMDGDTSHLPWAQTPDNIKQSAIVGVNHIVADPQATPKQSHESWLAFKKADGWVYGPEKDAEKKTHPCMVPYEDLSAHHRIKDTIFGSVVRGAIARYTGE